MKQLGHIFILFFFNETNKVSLINLLVRNVEIGLETLQKKIKDLCINDQSCHGNAFIRLTKTFPLDMIEHG